GTDVTYVPTIHGLSASDLKSLRSFPQAGFDRDAASRAARSPRRLFEGPLQWTARRTGPARLIQNAWIIVGARLWSDVDGREGAAVLMRALCTTRNDEFS